MIHIKYLVKDKDGNKYDPLLYGCTKCCIACDKTSKEQKECKYQKARGRTVQRMLYRAKEEGK